MKKHKTKICTRCFAKNKIDAKYCYACGNDSFETNKIHKIHLPSFKYILIFLLMCGIATVSLYFYLDFNYSKEAQVKKIAIALDKNNETAIPNLVVPSDRTNPNYLGYKPLYSYLKRHPNYGQKNTDYLLKHDKTIDGAFKLIKTSGNFPLVPTYRLEFKNKPLKIRTNNTDMSIQTLNQSISFKPKDNDSSVETMTLMPGFYDLKILFQGDNSRTEKSINFQIGDNSINGAIIVNDPLATFKDFDTEAKNSSITGSTPSELRDELSSAVDNYILAASEDDVSESQFYPLFVNGQNNDSITDLINELDLETSTYKLTSSEITDWHLNGSTASFNIILKGNHTVKISCSATLTSTVQGYKFKNIKLK